jgi:hypothetical protein
MNSVDLYCLLLAAAGMALVYWGKRRSFVRLNQLGVEQFPSYGRKVVSKLADGTLLAAGYGCVGGAILILLVEHVSEYLVIAVVLYIAFIIEEEWHGRRH